MFDRLSEESRRRIKEKIEQQREAQTLEAIQQVVEFDKTPADFKAHLDRFVIGQEKGKKIIATAIAFHYKRLGNALKEMLAEDGGDIGAALRHTRTPKANLLMIGPTAAAKLTPAKPPRDWWGFPLWSKI